MRVLPGGGPDEAAGEVRRARGRYPPVLVDAEYPDAGPAQRADHRDAAVMQRVTPDLQNERGGVGGESRISRRVPHPHHLLPAPARSVSKSPFSVNRADAGSLRQRASGTLTLTLGEPAHSSCRAGPARRRGSQRERDQHRRVLTTVPPFTEGTAPLRQTRG